MVNLDTIRLLRLKNRYTQEKLASYLGISVASYSQRERGDIRFNVVETLKLSKLYGLSLDEYNEIFLQGDLENEQDERSKVSTRDKRV